MLKRQVGRERERDGGGEIYLKKTSREKTGFSDNFVFGYFRRLLLIRWKKAISKLLIGDFDGYDRVSTV